MIANTLFRPRINGAADDVHWLTVSDLMSGLMMIFLFVAIAYMRVVIQQRDQVVVERDKIREVVVAWEETQDAVYQQLETEFRDDLPRWNAEIDRQDLVVRFREPEVLFQKAETALQERFKGILSDFFPRYVQILSAFSNCDPRSEDGKPRGCIEEIRIEGHTSSEWSGASSLEEAYFRNMELSQGRTRAVLQYCYSLPNMPDYSWLKDRIAAVGFSSARLIFDEAGREHAENSRRVEFRVKTTIEKQLMQIIESD